MKLQREVFFLDSPRGPLFCICTAPAGPLVGRLLYVPPFGEEMNKSRRMAALSAQRFASQGWCVLQVDLSGTGDSAGEFGDARWAGWLDDLSLAWQWLQTRCQSGPSVLWALRTGGLLASDWLRTASGRFHLLLWHPVLAGRQFLTQFLRLKVANEMLAEGAGRQVMKGLKEALAAGQNVEVAGYTLNPELAAGLEASAMDLAEEQVAAVQVLELGMTERSTPSPAVGIAMHKLTQSGVPLQVDTVLGAAFWVTQEIEEVPALIDVSCRVLRGWQT